MDQAGESEPPCTVTASYSVRLRRPTPFGVTLSITGEVIEIEEDRAKVMMSLSADGDRVLPERVYSSLSRMVILPSTDGVDSLSASFRTAELKSPSWKERGEPRWWTSMISKSTNV